MYSLYIIHLDFLHLFLALSKKIKNYCKKNDILIMLQETKIFFVDCY